MVDEKNGSDLSNGISQGVLMHKATIPQGKTKSFIGVVFIIVCGLIINWWVAQSTDAKMRSELLNQARTAAYAISVEDLISLTASERDIGTVPYERIKAQLASMRKAGPKTKFLYLIGKSSNGKIYFYADSLPQESEDYAFPGLIYDEVPDSYLRVFNSRREEVVGPITDRWGTLMTALVPISPQGSNKILAVLGMDIEAVEWTYIVLMGCIVPALLIVLLLLLLFIVSSRERLMIRLKMSEDSMRNILENATNMFYSHTVDHELTYVSPQSHEYLECSPEEAMIQWTKFATDNSSNKKGFELTQKAIETGVRQEPYELELIGEKGKEIFVEVRENPVLKEGRVVSIVGSLTDITERKQTEEVLRKSHERFLTVLNSIDATIYVADMQTYEVLFMNEYMINSFGRDMTGEICWEAFRGESEKCSNCPNDQLIDKNGKPTGVYTWQDLNSITGKCFNNYDRVIEWTDGHFVKIQIATDITEMINMEEQLRQAHKMESIGTLAGGIAHEFNNILAIIMGNNELVMEELPARSLARESSEEIRIAGLRARDVVKQLLTFSRQDDSSKKVMDFKFVVQESMKLIRSTTPTNITIEQTLSADTYPVLGNDTQISQLLINLCNNAVDAMPEKGGIITVKLFNDIIDKHQASLQPKLRPGEYAKLIVSDNGIGMDKETLDRVFEPFFTTKDVGKGSGIGMAVVHGIIERHDGVIIVDSDLGLGTVFSILLPAYAGPIIQEIDNQNDLPTGEECILYVDDETSIAHLGKRLLESLGYKTESTTDPLKALEMVKLDPHRFDLVISDMAMPNMTGDQLIVEILKIRQDIPTIICTGYSAKISEEDATKIGVRSYIMKPINKSELAKMVRKVLDDAKRY